MFSEFLVTDGTTIIDFLALNKRGYGLGITRYTPGRPVLKSGGIWQDSPLGSGRRLVHGTKGNVNDAVEFRIGYANHVELIGAQQELDLLLEKAIAYWTTDWQDEPVYIKARAAGEISARYAIIHSAEFPNYPDPYDQPYAGGGHKFVMDGMILGLERGDWLGNAPGNVTGINISHDYHAADSAIYVGNGYTTSGITHIYRYTETGGPAYSSNLINAALPYNLLDSAGVAAEDFTTAVYFGSPYPFTSVVFDIGTAATNLNIVWEISDGVGGYTDVLDIGGTNPLRDETDNFSLTGLHIVQWYDDFNFQPQALSSFGSRYWIRARLDSVDVGALTTPTQANQDPYTTKLPYVEMAAAQIPGSLDALASIRISTKSRDNTEVTWPQSVYLGLRSLTRSGVDASDFSAFINMRTADNPSGIAIDLTGTTTHTNTAVSSAVVGNSPTGYGIIYTGTTGDVLDECFRVNIDAAVVRQYYGRYRLFAKMTSIVVTNPVQLRARVKFQNAYNEFVGQITYLATADFAVGAVHLADLGYIQIPPTNLIGASEQAITCSIIIDGLCEDAQTITFYELVLLPVDEWSAVAVGTTTDDAGDFMTDIDSARYLKEGRRAVLRDQDTGNVTDNFQLITSQNVTLHANNQQRLWILQKNVDAHYGMSALVSISINPRYHFLRGD